MPDFSDPVTLFNDATGHVTYWPQALADKGPGADSAITKLETEIPWEQEQVRVRGRGLVPAPRLSVGLGDPGLVYRYAGQMKRAKPWTPLSLFYKAEVERLTGQKVNFVLCNYYADGRSYIGPHSDDERDLVEGSRILSLSLGASRDMVFTSRGGRRTRTARTTLSVQLDHGTVLSMAGPTQKNWKHGVPKRLRVDKARVNMTFRLIRKS